MNKIKKRQETKERYSGQRFFLGFGCGDAQGDFISQCTAVWIRTIKMAGNGEHMHFVYDNPGHFLWGVGSKADTGYPLPLLRDAPRGGEETF